MTDIDDCMETLGVVFTVLHVRMVRWLDESEMRRDGRRRTAGGQRYGIMVNDTKGLGSSCIQLEKIHKLRRNCPLLRVRFSGAGQGLPGRFVPVLEAEGIRCRLFPVEDGKVRQK